MADDMPQVFVRLLDEKGEGARVVSDRIESFTYVDSDKKADTIKLTVENEDLQNFDDPAFRKGAILEVAWGYPENMAPVRRGIIQKVTGFRELTVEAQATSVLMNKRGRTRTFENMKRSDVAEVIAEENGFGSDSRDIEETDRVFETIAQTGLTDAQLLTRLAAKEGFVWFVDFDGFHFHERRLGQRPIKVFRYYTEPGVGEIVGDPNVDNDVTAKPGRVKVKGRDPVEKTDIDAEADNESDSDRQGLGEVIELVDPDNPHQTIAVVKGAPDPGAGLAGAGAGANRPGQARENTAAEQTVSTSEATADSARKEAKARYRRAQRVAVKMNLPVIGDPKLLAKTVVQTEGMGKRLSQKYYVQEAKHTINQSGYETELDLISDGHGGHDTTSQLARGLSLVAIGGTGGGAGGGSGGESRVRLQDQLQALLQAAKAGGNMDEVQIATALLTEAQRSGFRARDRILNGLRQIIRSPRPQVAAQARGALSAVTQGRGAEEASGARPNTATAPEEGSDELQPVELVDPDTGETVTVWRQSPGRGKDS